MSQKAGFISHTFPRFSKKLRRAWNETKYTLKKKPIRYNTAYLKNAGQEESIDYILNVSINNPIDAEKMLEDKMTHDMFHTIRTKDKEFFINHMNSFEELLHSYSKLEKAQLKIEKTWTKVHTFFFDKFVAENKIAALDNYYIFLQDYLDKYLSIVRVRTKKVERHVNRIIDKLLFLSFLKLFGYETSFMDRKGFITLFNNEKDRLTYDFSRKGLTNRRGRTTAAAPAPAPAVIFNENNPIEHPYAFGDSQHNTPYVFKKSHKSKKRKKHRELNTPKRKKKGRRKKVFITNSKGKIRKVIINTSKPFQLN